MTDIAQLHRQALDSTRRTVAGIGGEQLGAAVNEGWDVRACLNHVVAGNWWAQALAGGASIESVGDRLDGDQLGDDRLKAYDASAEAAAAAFEAPGALEASCAVSYGPVPGQVYAGHRFLDVLIHGWDLAAATGQDTALPEDLVEACLAVIEPQRELLQASGMFGQPPDVPEGASRQVQLLAAMGRRG
jgi:uncharacterized protein (TIGR03086 family)